MQLVGMKEASEGLRTHRDMVKKTDMSSTEGKLGAAEGSTRGAGSTVPLPLETVGMATPQYKSHQLRTEVLPHPLLTQSSDFSAPSKSTLFSSPKRPLLPGAAATS